MQLTSNKKSAPAELTAADDDSGYVGKHRPGRMSLLRPRVRVSQLSGREVSPAK